MAFGILIGTLFSWWATFTERSWLLGILSTGFNLAVLGLVTERVTWVDRTEQKLHREGLFFGRIRLWHRTWRLSEFRGIVVKRVQTDEQVTVFVELVRLSGRQLGVCYYNESEPREARSVALSLAGVTGFQITDK
ncbi:MAG TPA: hypothetical protein VL527_01390 [Dongiaceae bacterium]|jgi:hypothetical protein|nr:hypothetical protein [Dongiaceae bacterium]